MACEVAFAGHSVFRLYRAAMLWHRLRGWRAAAAAFRHSVALL
jgi:hypothetical protein